MDITVVISLRRTDGPMVNQLDLVSEALVEVIEAMEFEVDDEETTTFDVISANVTNVEE